MQSFKGLSREFPGDLRSILRLFKAFQCFSRCFTAVFNQFHVSISSTDAQDAVSWHFRRLQGGFSALRRLSGQLHGGFRGISEVFHSVSMCLKALQKISEGSWGATKTHRSVPEGFQTGFSIRLIRFKAIQKASDVFRGIHGLSSQFHGGLGVISKAFQGVSKRQLASGSFKAFQVFHMVSEEYQKATQTLRSVSCEFQGSFRSVSRYSKAFQCEIQGV